MFSQDTLKHIDPNIQIAIRILCFYVDWRELKGGIVVIVFEFFEGFSNSFSDQTLSWGIGSSESLISVHRPVCVVRGA
jgi:hypothetical protein